MEKPKEQQEQYTRVPCPVCKGPALLAQHDGVIECIEPHKTSHKLVFLNTYQRMQICVDITAGL